MNYDNFGHPRTQKTTANGISRYSYSTYTPSGRFVSSKTNDLGQTTTYNWNETKGLLMSETDHWQRVTSHTYDSWGNPKESVYPGGLRKTQVLQWVGTISGKPANAQYYSYSETSGESPVWKWYDKLGREIRKDCYGLNEKKKSVDTEYNPKGQLYRVSDPYFTDNPGTKQWTTNYYDSYGRTSSVTNPMGTTSYAYSGLTTTVTSPTETVSTTTNAAGWTVSQKTNGKTVTFNHYASGLVKSATPEGGQAITMEYNLQGNRVKLTDPDAGIITSKYDGWGQLKWESQQIHLSGGATTTSFAYQPSGLLQSKTRNGETTNYSYDGNYRLSGISIPNKHSQTYSYDWLDRITQTTDVVENSKTFTTNTEYDELGRVSKVIYPSGYYTINQYDKYSRLTGITDRNGSNIWKALESNVRGQLTKIRQGNIETSFGFDSRGFPNAITAPGVMNMTYNFDYNGNMYYRQDNLTGYKETFYHDGMDRLTNWNVSKNGAVPKSNSMTFDSSMGNITNKSDLTYTMNYGANNKPHALTSISGVPSFIPSNNQAITYTDFKKVKTISENGNALNISYGVDEQRIKSVFNNTTNNSLTRYYIGGYEEEISGNNTRRLHYLSGGNGLAAIYVSNTQGGDTLYYAYTDYQGSLTALVLPSGEVKERYAFDPWGNRRNPENWEQTDSRKNFIVNRGYTMHEHLDVFCLINMNGRVYDPLTAMFMSPDPQLQSPGNWLNYNRYSYCMNNPMLYTDPSGEFFFSLFLPVIGTFLDAACWGALINGGLYTVSVALSPGGFNNWSWKDFGYSALNGAINGALSSVNPLSWNIGGLSIGLQPNLMVSSNGMGFGATLGVDYNVTKWCRTGIDIGVQHYFTTAGTEKYNEQAFTFGYGLEFGSKKYNGSLYSTYFAATDGSSQRTGGIGLNLGKFNMRYENDGAPIYQLFGPAFNDGKDRLRTNAVQLGWGDFNLRLNMMTGPGSGPHDAERITGFSSKYPNGYYEGGKVDDIRLGALSLGYKNYRVGVNSEGIREVFQNRFAHDSFFNRQAGYKVLNDNWYPYYYWGTTNRYNLW